MPIPLKQSTSVVVNFGPIVDKADGVTLESGLVSALDHVTTGIMLSKNGGAKAVRNGTPTASVYDNGDYRVTLNTTDTNTLGTLRLSYYDAAVCVPVWLDCVVLPANVYDSLYSTDKLQVHVDEMTAGIITAAVIATGAVDADAIAADAVTEIQSGLATASALATVDGIVDAILEDTAAMPAAATIADAVWDEAKSGHVAAGSFGEEVQAHATLSELQSESSVIVTDIVTEINLIAGATFDTATDSLEAIRNRGDAAWITATGFSTLDAAGVRSAVGLASANLDTQLGTIDNLVDDLESRLTADRAAYLDNLSGGNIALQDTLAMVQDSVGDIPESVWNQLLFGFNSNTFSMGWVMARQAINVSMTGFTASGSTTSVIVLDTDASDVDDFYNGHTFYAMSGDTINQSRLITDYDGTTRQVTLESALSHAMLEGDFYQIIKAVLPVAPTSAAIADAVWDEAKSGHVAAGSFGEEVQAHALTSDLATLATAAALATVDGIVDDILVDTGTTLPATLATLATAAALATVDGIVDDILVDTGTTLPATLATLATAAALDAVDNYVDTELASVKAVTDKLDTAMELDGAVYRFTTNALEQASSSGDWTAQEKEHIRHRLGIDGDAEEPSATPSLATDEAVSNISNIDLATVGSLNAIFNGARAKLYLSGVDILAGGNDSGILSRGSGTGSGIFAQGGATGGHGLNLAGDDTGQDLRLAAARVAGLHNISVADIWTEDLANETYNQGEAGDLLKSAALASAPEGVGSQTVVFSVEHNDNPIANVEVWITSDQAGTIVAAKGFTDDDGEITFYLDPGTYYAWRQKNGYTFTNPISIEVAND